MLSVCEGFQSSSSSSTTILALGVAPYAPDNHASLGATLIGTFDATRLEASMRSIVIAFLPSLLLAQAQPVPQTTAKPGWQWTYDSAMTVVNAVRAGRSLKP